MESVVKQKLKEAEEMDPGYMTILGKQIHRSNPWLNNGIFILVIIGCAGIAFLLPKILQSG